MKNRKSKRDKQYDGQRGTDNTMAKGNNGKNKNNDLKNTTQKFYDCATRTSQKIPVNSDAWSVSIISYIGYAQNPQKWKLDKVFETKKFKGTEQDSQNRLWLPLSKIRLSSSCIDKYTHRLSKRNHWM